MALEFISAESIMDMKKIPIPDRANCYRIKSGNVKFFMFNPNLPKDTREIPEESKEMSFEGFTKYAHWLSYGTHTFYDSEGNIIKVER